MSETFHVSETNGYVTTTIECPTNLGTSTSVHRIAMIKKLKFMQLFTVYINIESLRSKSIAMLLLHIKYTCKTCKKHVNEAMLLLHIKYTCKTCKKNM